MSILSRSEIKNRIADGRIIADGVHESQITEQSIDVSLYRYAFLQEPGNMQRECLDLANGFWLNPGQFLLAAIDEFVGTTAGSKTCAEFKLKSTPARWGLNHSLTGHIEEGYFNRLCLELTSYIPVKLEAGMLIGQFIFHTTRESEGVVTDYTKRGSYQSTPDLEKLKKNWKIEDILPKEIKIKQHA